MKKIFAFFLITLSAVLSLSACSEVETEYTIESFDAESRVQVAVDPNANTSRENSVEAEESQGEAVNATFLIKDKKYLYKENDVVLLDITNETNQNLSITITMTYYDQDGIEIKTEDRFFEQFVAGYQNYFLFRPDICFDDYSYTVAASAYEGEPIIDKYEFRFIGLEEERSYARFDENGNMLPNPEKLYFPTIMARITFGSTHTERMSVGVEMLLFNEKDELVYVKEFGYKIDPRQEIGKEQKNGFVYQTEEETLVWPEQYTGEIRAIFCYVEIFEPQEITP